MRRRVPLQINLAINTEGYLHNLFLKSDASLRTTGLNEFGELGDSASNYTNLPEQIVAGSLGYDQISLQLLSRGNVCLNFVGIAGANYTLVCPFSLVPPTGCHRKPIPLTPAGY